MFLDNRLRFVRCNVDSASRVWKELKKIDPRDKNNPHLKADSQCELIAQLVKTYGGKFPWSGYLEDRRHLWAGSYLEEGEKWIHLGIDFWVPEKTVITVDIPGKVVRIDDDGSPLHGWGKRIFIEYPPVVLVYAHLGEVFVKKGEKLTTGKKIASVGSSKENGGWAPHLHVQAIQGNIWSSLLKSDLADLDGYGPVADVEALSVQYPDPSEYLNLP